MKFDERQEQQAIIIRPLEQRLDSYVAEEFKAHMKNLIHNGHHQVVLDLGDVEFVDSNGLGAIIATMIALGPQGRLMVCAPHERVLALFRLSRMDRVISVVADPDEALRAMSRE